MMDVFIETGVSISVTPLILQLTPCLVISVPWAYLASNPFNSLFALLKKKLTLLSAVLQATEAAPSQSLDRASPILTTHLSNVHIVRTACESTKAPFLGTTDPYRSTFGSVNRQLAYSVSMCGQWSCGRRCFGEFAIIHYARIQSVMRWSDLPEIGEQHVGIDRMKREHLWGRWT